MSLIMGGEGGGSGWSHAALLCPGKMQGRPGFLGIPYTGAFKNGYTVYCSLVFGISLSLNFRYEVYLGIILVIFG